MLQSFNCYKISKSSSWDHFWEFFAPKPLEQELCQNNFTQYSAIDIVTSGKKSEKEKAYVCIS